MRRLKVGSVFLCSSENYTKLVVCVDYVQRYATKEAADAADGKGAAEEEDEDAEMSDIGSFSDHDDD